MIACKLMLTQTPKIQLFSFYVLNQVLHTALHTCTRKIINVQSGRNCSSNYMQRF